MNGITTEQTLALMKATLADPLKKSVSVATGLFGVDVTGPAKNLVPVYTPLRNRIARRGMGFGAATSWRQITALQGSGWNGMPWVPEGQRSAAMSYVSAPKAANYVTLGEEDSYTFEAHSAAQGQGFESEPSMVVVRLLQKLMLKEENALLGGNASLALGTPSTPTLSASAGSATLPAATYSVIVVALTQEALSSGSGISLSALLTTGVPTSKSVTGRDGNTYTLNGGSSNKSAAATQAITLGQSLLASVTPVNGAVAYAWFVGTAGSEKLEAITSINSARFSSPLVGGARQAASAVTADCSTNSGLAFDGILSTVLNPLNATYINTLATGTAGVGTSLTSSGRGSINEIDTMLQNMFDAYQLSPTRLYVSTQEQTTISNKVLSAGAAPLLNFVQQANTDSITAGTQITMYHNPYMVGGGQKIPIEVHPMVPPGTILAVCETLPPTYQNSQVGNIAEVRTRRDYYQVDWPLRTRAYEMGVYAEEVLAIYAPFAFGVIRNVAAG